MLSLDNTLSTTALAQRIGITSKAVEKHIFRLKADGVLRRIGPDKGGYWQVVEKRIDFSGGSAVCRLPTSFSFQKYPSYKNQNSIRIGRILPIVCCFFWGCFISTFPSVACFRCRRPPLYRRERGKVFGLNTLCPQRKILPETALPPDLFTFRKVCTNFYGRARKQTTAKLSLVVMTGMCAAFASLFHQFVHFL